jgi:hypothetical protein
VSKREFAGAEAGQAGSGAISDAALVCGAACAATGVAANLDAVTDDPAAAMRASRRQRMDGAFEPPFCRRPIGDKAKHCRALGSADDLGQITEPIADDDPGARLVASAKRKSAVARSVHLV